MFMLRVKGEAVEIGSGKISHSLTLSISLSICLSLSMCACMSACNANPTKQQNKKNVCYMCQRQQFRFVVGVDESGAVTVADALRPPRGRPASAPQPPAASHLWDDESVSAVTVAQSRSTAGDARA